MSTDSANLQPTKRGNGKPFVRGDSRINRGGKPRGSVSIRATLERCATKSDIETAVRTLIQRAKEGSAAHLKILLQLKGELSETALSLSVEPTSVVFSIPDNGRPLMPPALDIRAIASPLPEPKPQIPQTVENSHGNSPDPARTQPEISRESEQDRIQRERNEAAMRRIAQHENVRPSYSQPPFFGNSPGTL
jgi:hypothetical protein